MYPEGRRGITRGAFIEVLGRANALDVGRGVELGNLGSANGARALDMLATCGSLGNGTLDVLGSVGSVGNSVDMLASCGSAGDGAGDGAVDAVDVLERAGSIDDVEDFS